MSDNSVFPGDKIASIEEYEAGHNTFDDGDMVRTATIGKKDFNKERREKLKKISAEKEKEVSE